MKLKNLFLLNETPLPDDWDHDLFDPNVPFSKRLQYARRKADEIAKGSSRVAFVIPYEGRNTVLKIARNKRGIVQNRHEARILNIPVAKNSRFFIPIIDHDTTGNTWIHVEHAHPVTYTEFENYFGTSPLTLSDILRTVDKHSIPIEKIKTGDYISGNVDYDNENLLDFIKMYKKIGGHSVLTSGDMVATSNWGVYNDNVVIIDAGVNEGILDHYYRGKGGSFTHGTRRTSNDGSIDN